MNAGVAPPPSITARFSGGNGVEVEVQDDSSPYGYANLFRVRLRVVARVPGCLQPHERTLERLGVPAEDVERSQRDLLEHFREHALPYLLRPDFPLRFAEHQRRSRGAVIRFPAPP